MTVESLRIDQVDLNTKRMLDLMAGGTFDSHEFKSQIMDAGLTPAPLGPLGQRLDTLESFMAMPHTDKIGKKGKQAVRKKGTN
jgi:hypothetical protein